MNRKAIIYLTLTFIAIVFTLTSCKKEYISKKDKKSLFALPTDTELDNLFIDWENRNLTPTDYQVVQQENILSGAFMLKIVSFKVNNTKQYGALIIPNTTSIVPVQILVGGFALNNTINSVNLALGNSGSGGSNILAIPALRGQSLAITINGTLYNSPLSEGNHCDAFDKATDDVLAFLNLIQQTETIADVNRTGVRGGSRGGTVAMLTGIRDPRIKRVVGVVSPTNMLELTSQNVNDDTYQCQFLSAYKNGQATLEETRNKMIASSPFYFAQHLPLMQLHLGIKDINVPVKQGYDLEQKIIESGNVAKFQSFTYDKTHTDIASNNPDLAERIKQFLSQL
ncbi:MAG: prolyl oligopeptidase family serine peptidase [Pelobium sp.]